MCGTTPTEHLLNAGRRTQTSQKARNSLCTWVGQKKKERQKNRDGTCTSGRELWRRKSFHTLGSPFTGGDSGWVGWKLQGHGGECSHRGAEGKAETFPHRGSVPTCTHQPKRLVCSPARAGWRGLGTEALASEVRSQGEDWGWLCEHSLKGASAPQLARRESRKKSGTAKEARDFSLPLCFLVHEERGLRVTLKGTPETGVSRGYQRGPQRRAWDAKAAAATTTKKPVCEHRSLSTPPLPGACAACHCQGPVIQGQLPQGEHMARLRLLQRHTALCRWRLAPHSVLLPRPGLSEAEPPDQLLL